jgi:hypothetical protein
MTQKRVLRGMIAPLSYVPYLAKLALLRGYRSFEWMV